VTAFLSAVPIVPARDVEATTAWYRDELGFDVYHVEPAYGIVGRGESWIHFWGPSGIDPLETDAMIRLGVRGIDELYDHCRAREIVHPSSSLQTKPWGFQEFAVLDRDGTLVTFFETPEGHRPVPVSA
jgi:catechol 2,3-dioxygenase-like lactoylglutathione lyase family enzyme